MREAERVDSGGCSIGGHHIQFPGKAVTMEQTVVLVSPGVTGFLSGLFLWHDFCIPVLLPLF